jgi:hypothetical protein
MKYHLHAKVEEIYRLLGETVSPQDIGKKDVRHEFALNGAMISLTQEDDGFHLRDGDPICNWCGNTFDQRYPLDADASKLAARVLRELTDNQPRKFRAWEDAWEQRYATFAAKATEVGAKLPAGIFREEPSHLSTVFAAGDRRVVLSMEGEFNDIWLRGRGCVKVRRRWVDSEYQPTSIAREIVQSLLDVETVLEALKEEK